MTQRRNSEIIGRTSGQGHARRLGPSSPDRAAFSSTLNIYWNDAQQGSVKALGEPKGQWRHLGPGATAQAPGPARGANRSRYRSPIGGERNQTAMGWNRAVQYVLRCTHRQSTGEVPYGRARTALMDILILVAPRQERYPGMHRRGVAGSSGHTGWGVHGGPPVGLARRIRGAGRGAVGAQSQRTIPMGRGNATNNGQPTHQHRVGHRLHPPPPIPIGYYLTRFVYICM